jgi:deoxycytidine triphosphate deaminase
MRSEYSGAVLPKIEIERRLSLDLEDPESLVITPLLDGKAFDADSVDLRLGRHFLLPRTLHKPFFCPDSRSQSNLHTEVFIPFGKYLVVPAHQTVLGATLEFIKLPHDVCGEILTKSSVARSFVLIETAPWVHPDYRGCLTLEIANVSNTPVLLYPGRLIGQLILLPLARLLGVRDQMPATGLPASFDTSGTGDEKKMPDAEPPQRLGATYFGPVYPEPPKFNDPEDDLWNLGVDETWTITEQVNSRDGHGQKVTRPPG